jgi:hypothetical protein
MPSNYQRRRRAIYSALAPLHHEAPAEAIEERGEDHLEHLRREVAVDDDAPPGVGGGRAFLLSIT